MHHNLLAVIILVAIFSVASGASVRAVSVCNDHTQQIMSAASQTRETFLYFAYGSNLLSKRLHIQNPSAKRVFRGKLDGYRLDFITQSKRWNGASATIVKDDAASVWGAIWELDISNMASLDNQEGVHQNIYRPLTVNVACERQAPMSCRTYQQIASPRDGVPLIDLPVERRPSRTYLETIQNGAVESALPEQYLEFLWAIPHNGRTASVDLLVDLLPTEKK